MRLICRKSLKNMTLTSDKVLKFIIKLKMKKRVRG